VYVHVQLASQPKAPAAGRPVSPSVKTAYAYEAEKTKTPSATPEPRKIQPTGFDGRRAAT
jgi:hypothetical protein